MGGDSIQEQERYAAVERKAEPGMRLLKREGDEHINIGHGRGADDVGGPAEPARAEDIADQADDGRDEQHQRGHQEKEAARCAALEQLYLRRVRARSRVRLALPVGVDDLRAAKRAAAERFVQLNAAVYTIRHNRLSS